MQMSTMHQKAKVVSEALLWSIEDTSHYDDVFNSILLRACCWAKSVAINKKTTRRKIENRAGQIIALLQNI